MSDHDVEREVATTHEELAAGLPMKPLPYVEVDERGRPDFKRRFGRRVYGCRVRLIATSPVSGKIMTPSGPFAAQRIKVLDQKFVHESAFQPGGRFA